MSRETAPRDLNSLLRWSVEQTPVRGPSDPLPRPISNLDPAIIDALIGKSDAKRMQEIVSAIEEPELSPDQRDEAWDELEMVRISFLVFFFKLS
jgi:hsp70-interacting protein